MPGGVRPGISDHQLSEEPSVAASLWRHAAARMALAEAACVSVASVPEQDGVQASRPHAQARQCSHHDHQRAHTLPQACSWTSSGLDAPFGPLLAPRRGIDNEILFADSKEEHGRDHSQVMSAQAVARVDAGDTGLRACGRSAEPPACSVAMPSNQWRHSARDPASPSSSRA